MSKPSRKQQKAIDRIAREVLDLETLEPRGRDHLDFHVLGVWEIRRALMTAYEAGRAAGADSTTRPSKGN